MPGWPGMKYGEPTTTSDFALAIALPARAVTVVSSEPLSARPLTFSGSSANTSMLPCSSLSGGLRRSALSGR